MSFLVCFRARYSITVRYAVGRLGTRSHAFFIHETRVRLLATGLLIYGKQCVSLRRANKGVEKACVYVRLPRGAKLADSAQHTRFVCAILGLSLRAWIRGLRRMVRIRTLRHTLFPLRHARASALTGVHGLSCQTGVSFSVAANVTFPRALFSGAHLCGRRRGSARL